MIDFFKQDLVPADSLTITPFYILLLFLIMVAAITINAIISRVIRNSSLFQNVDLKRKRLLFNIFRILVWILAIASGLALIGLDMNNFWDFNLIGGKEESKFHLQPRHFVIAFVVLAFTRIILMALERAFSSGSQFKTDDRGRSRAVYKFISYLVWVTAVLIVLSQTGLNLTIIWGAGAALLVGVGFGLQQIIADLVSGIFLLFEGNLREGDVVELNSGVVGQVENVGIRTSKILTRDDYIMIIPNTEFITKEVINWSHNELKTRFHIDVGVAYGSDVRLVEQILHDVAAGHQGVSKTPEPFVRFDNFGNSSLDFQLFFWSKRTFRIENLKSDMRFMIDAKFRERGVQIPFPQRDIHIRTK